MSGLETGRDGRRGFRKKLVKWPKAEIARPNPKGGGGSKLTQVINDPWVKNDPWVTNDPWVSQDPWVMFHSVGVAATAPWSAGAATQRQRKAVAIGDGIAATAVGIRPTRLAQRQAEDASATGDVAGAPRFHRASPVRQSCTAPLAGRDDAWCPEHTQGVWASAVGAGAPAGRASAGRARRA